MTLSALPASSAFAATTLGIIGNETGLSLTIVGALLGGAWYVRGMADDIKQIKKDVGLIKRNCPLCLERDEARKVDET